MTALAASVMPLDRLWPRTAGTNALRTATLIFIGTGLLALSAHIQAPFWPVKLSMQTFVVLAIGIAYGGRLGGVTIVAYLSESALGLSVFQSGAGIAYLVGPTGGFLFGFVMLSRFPTAIATLLLAEAAIYIPGVA